MNEETIEKIISKHKLYMSMDSYEYEAITKVDLYKLIEEIERLRSIIKEVREYIEAHIKYECNDAFNGKQFYSYHLYDFDEEELLEILQGVDKN